jgi:hypothetical protein
MSHSEKWNQVMKDRMSGSKNPMFKGAKLVSTCKTCGVEFAYYKSNKSGKFCSQKCSSLDPDTRLRFSTVNKGRKHTPEARAKMSASRGGVPKTPAARIAIRDGIRRRFASHVSNLSTYNRVRNSTSCKEWSQKVIERAGFACEKCGNKNCNLDAHHIFPFSMLINELEMGNISESEIHNTCNGRCLCRKCHREEHINIGGFTPIEVRLLRTIKKDWLKNGGSGLLSSFYSRRMEGFIESVKRTLLPDDVRA